MEHFRKMRHPSFSVTANVDVTGLRERAARHGATPWLAYHHAALEAANEIDAFRQTLMGDGVFEYAQVHASTTVLRDDGSFGIVNLLRGQDLASFAAAARPRAAQAKLAQGGLFSDSDALPPGAVLHLTTLPWLAFTSFTHARGEGDDRPKIAFGRMTAQGGGQVMPVAVDVHHALVDGVHVGRFFERLQAHLQAV